MANEIEKLETEAVELCDAVNFARLRQKEILMQIAIYGEGTKDEIDVSPQELILLRDYIFDRFGDGSEFSNRDLCRLGPNSTRKKTSAIVSILLDAGLIKQTQNSKINYCVVK